MLKQVMEIVELLDDSRVDGEKVKQFLNNRGLEDITVTEMKGETLYTLQ